jgi:hypothetical protein
MNDRLDDLIRLRNKKRLASYREMISSRSFCPNINKGTVDDNIIKDGDIDQVIAVWMFLITGSTGANKDMNFLIIAES